MSTAFAILGVAVTLALIIWLANWIINEDRWWFCPRCLHWFNDMGETHPGVPSNGYLQGITKTCPKCCRIYNDSV